MKTARTYREVRDRLGYVYPDHPATAAALFATWMQFAAEGEDATRRHMSRRTYFRHRKQLQDAAISWHGADIGITEGIRLVPADFAPLPGNSYHVTDEDPRVSELLAPYRAA